MGTQLHVYMHMMNGMPQAVLDVPYQGKLFYYWGSPPNYHTVRCDVWQVRHGTIMERISIRLRPGANEHLILTLRSPGLL